MARGDWPLRSLVVERIPRSLRVFEPWIEDDYEKQVVRSASVAFPGYEYAVWKPLVRDRGGRAARPDGLMVSADGSSWFVVEVELSWHTADHIMQQLDILGDGVYDPSLSESIEATLPRLGDRGVRSLLEHKPGFLCIVNAFTEAIQAICRASPFDLVVAEPYRSEAGDYALALTQVPAILRGAGNIAGMFVLTRGRKLGDSEFAELPKGFPNWAGPIDLLLPDTTLTRTQIVGNYLLLHTALGLPGRSLGIRIVDPSKQILQLEILA